MSASARALPLHGLLPWLSRGIAVAKPWLRHARVKAGYALAKPLHLHSSALAEPLHVHLFARAEGTDLPTHRHPNYSAVSLAGWRTPRGGSPGRSTPHPPSSSQLAALAFSETYGSR